MSLCLWSHDECFAILKTVNMTTHLKNSGQHSSWNRLLLIADAVSDVADN